MMDKLGPMEQMYMLVADKISSRNELREQAKQQRKQERQRERQLHKQGLEPALTKRAKLEEKLTEEP